MKLTLDDAHGRNRITSCGPGYVAINGLRYTRSLVVTPEAVSEWPVAELAALSVADIGALLDYRPEVALIGTGARMAFPPAAVLRPLIEARIGHEIMDTAAACRTYGILAAEGRRVVAALIVAA